MKHDYGKWRSCEVSSVEQPRVNLCKLRSNPHGLPRFQSVIWSMVTAPVGQARQDRCYISTSFNLKDKDSPTIKPFLTQAEAGDLMQHHSVEKVMGNVLD